MTADSVTLGWNPPVEDGGSPVTKYVIESKQDRDGEWTLVSKVPDHTTEYTVTSLGEGVEYDFRVCAENEIGRGKPTSLDRSIKPEREPGL